MIKPQTFANIPSPGVLGWNNFTESESIEDQELADALNIVYDGGFASPRGGSSLFAAKPAGETGFPLQISKAKTSDGIEYLIAVYGAIFYVYNPLASVWVRINQTYTPTETTLYWGNINWNNGRGDDRWYACNGVDSFIRWYPCVTTVAITAIAGVGTVTVADATRFPATGTLVIKGVGSTFTEPYTSKAGNVFTLTNTTDQAIAVGDSVVLQAVERSSMTKGKILGKHQSRLVVTNRFGAETAGTYSVTNDPENFTVSSSVTAASTFVIADGNGEITGVHDFGETLVIEKEDSLHALSIVISDSLASKLDKIKPIISGASVGMISQMSTIKMLNQLYYPTRTEGFMVLDPSTSGNSTSTGLEVISRKIQTYATKAISTARCRGTSYRQNAIWAVGRPGANANTLVIMYDTLRKAWSRIEGWAVTDWATVNNNLYYMENGSGNIIQCFDNSFNDQNNPYEVSQYCKRFNFGLLSQPKSQDALYVQGYMTPATDLFVDVLFNEGGILNKQTFRINKDTPKLLYSQSLTDMLGASVLGQAALGYVTLMEIGDVSFFRCYLGIDITKGFFNIQPRFYSNCAAFYAVTGIGFNAELNPNIDAAMVISPILL